MPNIKILKPTAPVGKRKYRKRGRKPISLIAEEIKLKIVRDETPCFNPKPFWKMTDAEIRRFAFRQALAAAKSIPMSEDEQQQYASAVCESIRYFNGRDPRHAEHIKYLEEIGTVTSENSAKNT